MSRRGNVVNDASRAAARGLIFLIQLYRHMVSPLRLPTCRFMPTCSQYAVEALTEYGLIRGSWLAAIRLAKCGPWHQGGWDPIPECRVVPADVGGTKRGESASVV
ncbi:MAG: membrane protein insertion efficiency factor YidD [Mycobacterium sp.]|nr:membrane protein insertion efficiency factor YidD [Mycobacterium sp.]MBV9351350.1 membrane protein insertion efficiency factor YidD [Mycobacterium sp.]